jgi:hypothetical protein
MDDVLAIPTEAILDSGRRKIVFVSIGDGRFEPREIVTGLTGDHHMTEILSGLVEGDPVVVSGQFLIDSESQLQEAIRKMLSRRSGEGEDSADQQPETVFSCPMHPEVIAAEPGRCSVCGMDLEERDATPAELASLHGEHMREQADDHGDGIEEPVAAGEYMCPMHPEVVSDEPGRCPVCGMFLEKVAVEGGEDR